MKSLLRILATIARLVLAVIAGYVTTILLCLSFLSSALCGHNAYLPLLGIAALTFFALEAFAAARRAMKDSQSTSE